jgi:UDP-N-acetylglucosamine acyltransferase
MLSGHIVVDDFAVIGGMVGIVQFVRIGTMGFVGGMSKLAGDVMPYCIADGGPAVTRSVNKIGMQRRGLSDAAIKTVREAFKTVFRSGLRLEDAVAKLRADHPDSPEVATMIAFATAPTSRVGLARSHD